MAADAESAPDAADASDRQEEPAWRRALLQSCRRRDEMVDGLRPLFEQYLKYQQGLVGTVFSPPEEEETVQEPKTTEEFQKALSAAQQKLKDQDAQIKALEAELSATQRMLKEDVATDHPPGP
eukprot:s906_g15.t1